MTPEPLNTTQLRLRLRTLDRLERGVERLRVRQELLQELLQERIVALEDVVQRLKVRYQELEVRVAALEAAP